MHARRIFLAGIVFVAVLSAIGGTLSYGLYYRSEAYRRDVERALSGYFGLPFEIGAVRPHSLSSRLLEEVTVWLPERRARVFFSPRIVWGSVETEGQSVAVLDIHDAHFTFGVGRWEQQDYLRVLRASLQHDFAELGIRQIRLHNARFEWARQDMRVTIEQANGNVFLQPDGRGRAELQAYSLNEQPVHRPIRITATLDPYRDEFIPEVILETPELPIEQLQFTQYFPAGADLGTFSGAIILRQDAGAEDIEAEGYVHDLDLQSATAGLDSGPIDGQVDLDIEKLLVHNRQLIELAFNGKVRDVDVGGVMALAGQPPVPGRMDLEVYNGLIRDGRIEWLGLGGQWQGGSADALARRFLGSGGINGQLHVKLNALIIENNEPTGGNLDIWIEPPADEPGLIEKKLLLTLVEKYLEVSLPRAVSALLPERVEYTQFGAKLLLEGRQLRMLSRQGPDGPTLVTIRMAGRKMPLFDRFDERYSLDGPLSQLHTALENWLAPLKERLRQRLPSRTDNERLHGENK